MTTPGNSDDTQENSAKPGFDRQLSGMLKTMYGSVESEAIPERFLDLLEKLDQAEKAQSGHPSGQADHG